MKLLSTYRHFLVLILLLAGKPLLAQQTIQPPQSSDSERVIQIIQGKSLRQKTVDSGFVIEMIAGNVHLKEGITLFDCDSAVIYHHTNMMEAFGNVHINQNDSVNTYSQHLLYVANDRVAFLDKDVKLIQNKGTLYTQNLRYDLKTNIADYSNGGKVVNGKTVLTSDNGRYYADTKDVDFKNHVHLIDPKYDIVTDSMLYNTQTQLATFITDTHIKSKNGGDIFTKEGTYDLTNGKGYFGARTIFKDSTRTYVSDNSAYDEKSKIFQLEGNAVIRDSVNGYIILGNQIFLNQNNNTFLATRKPVLIITGKDGDSTYIAADTLFSGLAKKDTVKPVATATANSKYNKQTKGPLKTGIAKTDSLNATIAKADSLKTNAPLMAADSLKADSLKIELAKNDSLNKPAIAIQTDSLKPKVSANEIVKTDSIKMDTLKKTTVIHASANASDSVRYFLGFHHVRIFNDSLQAVSDSLYYSTEDSTFRLFQNPLVFANHSQISGDTIFLYTKNNKPARLYVFNNGMMINHPNPDMYNQITGRTINGYFKDGQLDYMRAKGTPAESVYYPQSEDSSYIGMNRSKGDVIDIYFLNKEVNKVKFINDVDGTLYPLRQIPPDQKYLKNFKWQDERRPKNKLELFE